MPYLEVNGTNIFYERKGSGPVVLTFHGGLGMDHTHIMYETERLQDRFEFIYFDLRANGKSINRDDSDEVKTFTYEQLVDDAEELRKKLNLGKVNIFGSSLGLYLALLYSLRHPESVNKIIGNCGPARFDFDFSAGLKAAQERSPEITEMMKEKAVEEPGTEEEIKDNFRCYFYLYSYKLTDTVKQHVDRMVKDSVFNPPTLQRDEELRKDANLLERLKDIRQKTLIMAGRYDVISPEYVSEIAEMLPESKFVVFENSGHWPSYEEPEKFDKTISEFLNE